MKIKLKNIRDQVIVITGASSGIGLVTARMAARQGARVVLASRDEAALKQLAEELRSNGTDALAVRTDVTRQDDMRRLADAAGDRFGGFDTWVNDAGVSIYGRVLEVPVEDERRLFDVNFWGMVYGSKIAAEYLRRRGGALINLGSVASDTAIPLQGAYAASKHAIKAYTDTLRMELEKDNAPVSVTLIKPTAIDTPFFEHAKTYMGLQPTEPSPMYAPEAVAEAILHAAQHPVRDLLIGDIAPVQSLMGRLAPGLGAQYSKAVMFEGQQDTRRPHPADNQILERPARNLRERGRYDAMVFERSLYTKAAMHPVLAGAVTVGAGLLMAAAMSATGLTRARTTEDKTGA